MSNIHNALGFKIPTPPKPLSQTQMGRIGAIFRAVTHFDCYNYSDIGKHSGLTWTEVMNTLTVIRRRKQDSGIVVFMGTTKKGMKYVARRLDGSGKPFTADEHAAYMAGEARALRQLASLAINTGAMIRASAEFLTNAQDKAIRNLLADQILAAGNTATHLINIAHAKRAA